MSSDLSIRNMVVISRVGDYWVDAEQAERIKNILQDGKKGMLELSGSYISINAIDGVVTAADYAVVNNRRQGMWQCKYEKWHERNEKCAHGQMMKRM